MNDAEKESQFKELQRQYREGERKLDRYPGILNEPILIDQKRWPPEADRGDKIRRMATKSQLQYQEQIFQLADLKWELLFWLYGIETVKGQEAQAWESLARALVCQHVPGFAVADKAPKAKQKRGAPRKYDVTSDAAFVYLIDQAVEDLKESPAGKAVNIKNAIRRALKKNYLGRLALKANGQPLDLASIETRYFEALKRVKDSPLHHLLDPDGRHPQKFAEYRLRAVLGLDDYK